MKGGDLKSNWDNAGGKICTTLGWISSRETRFKHLKKMKLINLHPPGLVAKPHNT